MSEESPTAEALAFLVLRELSKCMYVYRGQLSDALGSVLASRGWQITAEVRAEALQRIEAGLNVTFGKRAEVPA